MAIGSIYDREDKEAVEPLINVLKKGDKGSRVRAARALGMIGDSRAVEPLIQALKGGDGDVRMAAAEALGYIKDDRAVEPLIQALKDGNRSYRMRAARALGMIGDLRAVEPLIQALKYECYQMKYRSIGNIKNVLWALGRIGEPAVESLVQALRDKDSHFRWGAALALEKIGWLPKNTGKVLSLIGKSEWDEIAIVGKPAVEFLIQALNDSDLHIRMGAARTLGKIGDARAMKPLIQALEDGYWEVRSMTAEALGNLGEARAVEPLVTLLREKDPRDKEGEVLRAAAEALDKLGWKPENDSDEVYYLMAKGEWEKLAERGAVAVDPLLEALHYGWNYLLRVGAAKTLGMIGDQRAVEPLLEIVSEVRGLWEGGYRCEAAEALAKIGDRRAVESLRKALVNKEEYLFPVRLCVAKVLDELGWEPRNYVEKAYHLIVNNEWEKLLGMGELAVDPLFNVLLGEGDLGYVNPYQDVQLNALQVLIKIGGKEVIKHLAKNLDSISDNTVHIEARYALEKLGVGWQDGTVWWREDEDYVE